MDERYTCETGSGQTLAGPLTVIRPTSFWGRGMGLLVCPPLCIGQALWLDPCGGVHTWAMDYPIDVVFLDRQNRVLRIQPDVAPWRIVLAPRSARSVLELRAGEAVRFHVGTVLEFTRADRR